MISFSFGGQASAIVIIIVLCVAIDRCWIAGWDGRAMEISSLRSFKRVRVWILSNSSSGKSAIVLMNRMMIIPMLLFRNLAESKTIWVTLTLSLLLFFTLNVLEGICGVIYAIYGIIESILVSFGFAVWSSLLMRLALENYSTKRSLRIHSVSALCSQRILFRSSSTPSNATTHQIFNRCPITFALGCQVICALLVLLIILILFIPFNWHRSWISKFILVLHLVEVQRRDSSHILRAVFNVLLGLLASRIAWLGLEIFSVELSEAGRLLKEWWYIFAASLVTLLFWFVGIMITNVGLLFMWMSRLRNSTFFVECLGTLMSRIKAHIPIVLL